MSMDQNNIFSALDPEDEKGVFDSEQTLATVPAKTNKLIYLIVAVIGAGLLFLVGAVVSKLFFSQKPEHKTVPIVDVTQAKQQQPVTQLSPVAKVDNLDQVADLQSDVTESDKNGFEKSEQEVKDISNKLMEMEGVNNQQSQQIGEIIKRLNEINQSIESIRKTSSDVAKSSMAVKNNSSKKTRHPRVNIKPQTVAEINKREDAAIKAELANDLKIVSAKKTNGKIKLKAVVEDRAWIEDARGYTTTVTNGDTVPGMGTVISLDSDNFTVRFDSGRVIKGE